jgi:hypothetical protein
LPEYLRGVATFGNIYGWRLEEIPSFKWSQVDRMLGIIGLKLAKPRTMRAGLCPLMMKSGKYLLHSGKTEDCQEVNPVCFPESKGRRQVEAVLQDMEENLPGPRN